ncbi:MULTISPECIES: DUF421 domain-containing protein [Bacillus]|uniref:YetF C-terminal domain-containing protein n=2 Tax=Bacillus TaxID=1386 RepID=A0A0M5JLS1_9BACI|nr:MULTISPECIES: DUF421 domain-containing protein [Bacillus]ALC81827.1 hypothetical protein AM592_09585 [Bacillus gobiensis]MBP1080937.1 uncharacterized membrane protein YcaP (DUF421 family) [Bacillus capparidis]MED1097573.1 DUF421 domain-containing protein [Bacillus capparidis]
MHEILLVAFRTVLLYIVILIVFRLMGKREIGELSILDLVVFIMIAEIAVLGIEDLKANILQTIVPIVLLMAIQISLAYLSLKSQKLRQVLDGKPTIIIDRGEIDEHAMRKQRYNFDDLMIQLRENEVEKVSDVSYAILEPSGKLTVLKKGKDGENNIIEVPLVIDGIIQTNHLQQIGKDEGWLRDKLMEKGYTTPSQISFCSYQGGELYIDEKDGR